MLRLTICSIALAACAICPAAASTITMDFQAYIDGEDQLIIRGPTLQWHHLTFAAVGRYAGANLPTVITTAIDGVTQMDAVQWIPTWPLPPPDEIRFEAFSSIFTGLTPAFPVSDVSVSLDVIQARSLLTIAQQPSLANGFTLILDFDDNAPSGPAFYEGEITFSTGPTAIPEPAPRYLFATALLMFLPWRKLSKTRDSAIHRYSV
jgi:hypothetical protein